MPTAWAMLATCTRTSTPTGSMSGPIRSGARTPGGAPGRRGRAVESLSRTTPWLRSVLPHGRSRRSGMRRNAQSRSTGWTAPPSRTSRTCWRSPGTGKRGCSSERWRGSSIRIIRLVLGAAVSRRLSPSRLPAARALIPKAYMPGQHFSLGLSPLSAASLASAKQRPRPCANCSLSNRISRASPAVLWRWHGPNSLRSRWTACARPASTSTARGRGPPSVDAAIDCSPPVASGALADEGFWVAVLPFKYTGANADLTALAEGLSEEIVTGLSRFSYLRVIAAARRCGSSIRPLTCAPSARKSARAT